MKYKELQEEKADDKNNWGDENVIWNIDIVDTMDYACTYNACPETLNTFDTGIVFPAKGLLSEREIPWVINETEKGKSSSSIERNTDHTEKCVGEVSEYRTENGIVQDNLVSLPGMWEVQHVFDILRKGKTNGDKSYTIDIVSDALCAERRSKEVPKYQEDYERHKTYPDEESITRFSKMVVDTVDEEQVDKHDRESERFTDTEYQECELRKLLETCEKKCDNLGSDIMSTERRLQYLHEIIFCQEVFQNRDEITSLDIYLEEKKWYFFSGSRIMYGPVKGQEDTRNHDNTSEEESQGLP